MFEQKCVVCKKRIASEDDEVHILDQNGFTHHFCSKCGEEIKKKLKQREGQIKGN